MKNDFEFFMQHCGGIKKTLLTSAITGGPNAMDLALALIGKKKVYFWLDDSVELKVRIKSMASLDNREIIWEIKGTLEYATVPFTFVMEYDSFNRRGDLENARSFKEIQLLIE